MRMSTGFGRLWGARGMAVAIAISMVLTGFVLVGAVPGGLGFGAPHGTPGGAAATRASPVALGGGSLVSGSFFTNTPLPLPAMATRVCDNGTTGPCSAGNVLNITNDPAMVYTSTGLLAVAYTAVTSQSPCLAGRSYSLTNIGFVTSSNNGASWSAPTYLGSSDCSSSGKYPSSWQPALAALGDGTLVLAYVEYNLTGALPPMWNPAAPPVSRLVLTESSNNGATWTTPQVLNVSTNLAYSGVYFAPALPTLATSGKTIYLSWERLGSPGASPSENSQIALLVSTTGGATWSPTIPITSGAAWSMNPSLLVNPAGTVFLAYATNPTGSGISAYDLSTGNVNMQIAVATSTSNGTIFTTNYLSSTFETSPLLGSYYSPAPQLAWGAANGELYMTFTAIDRDAHQVTASELEFASSPNNGTTWRISSTATSAVYDPAYSTPIVHSSAYDPGVYDAAVAVDPSGTIYVNALVRNGTMCRMNQCGVLEDLVTTSANNGSTFTPAVLVNGNVTPGNGSWFGERTAAIIGGSQLWVAYPTANCPVWPTANCSAYPSTPLEQTQVTLATPFSGTGVTVQFRPSGLNATLPWVVMANGRNYRANGTNWINVTGFPTGNVLLWTVYGINATKTLRFYPVGQTLSGRSPITAASTDLVTFARFYPFEISLGGGASTLLSENCEIGYV